MTKTILSTLFLTCILFANAQTNYPVVVIETNYGTMKAMLYDDTPNHSSHFLKLVKQGYFNGTLFHRVIPEFMIQGGAQDSKNAPAGAQIGGGRTDMDLMPEFHEHRFHKKGALAAPRRDDNVNPQKKSDASQFYIVHGKVYTQGRLDTMEMAVNVPIKNKIIKEHYSPYRDKLAELKSTDAGAFNALLDSLLTVVNTLYEAAPGKFFLPPGLKEAYTTIGGAHHLDDEYTVFGEVTEGLEVIDKIAALPVDGNSRPKTDARIVRVYVEPS
ncbi:MAG: peptidylprolyl isomerase [Bacteroidia bacterium]|nr:peptidylprolyl isomerase [Bacteroidia bacterium]